MTRNDAPSTANVAEYRREEGIFGVGDVSENAPHPRPLFTITDERLEPAIPGLEATLAEVPTDD
ncbi:hypothetical protein [Halomarina pelagica]|uniref:hypothetical protein n=1 Tax=Halomarina pelagica TaxID=2961599 RepID=UPI0020C1DD30|nr:hypothetical protein [Halomarina sp. BND7]